MAPDVTERGPAEAKTLASLSLITLKWTKYLIVSTKYLSWCMPPSHGVFFLFQSHPQWITELPEPRRSYTLLHKGTECFKSTKAVCSSRGSSEVHLKKRKLTIKYFPSCDNNLVLFTNTNATKAQSSGETLPFNRMLLNSLFYHLYRKPKKKVHCCVSMLI